MQHFGRTGLIIAAAAYVAAGTATKSHALDVKQVQLGVVDSGGSGCPREAKVTAWAHTDGPGTVKFVIRNNSGGKTGELSATAVKGPTGNYLAAYSQTFKITSDVDIKYMAEVIGHGKISNWVTFKATCGPQVRTSKTTAASSGKKPPAKKASDPDDDGPQPRKGKTTTKASHGGPKAKHISESKNKGKPKSGGKPLPSGGKPIDQCKPMLSASRKLAATRVGGIATAQAAWQATALAAYGAAYSRWSNARSQSSSCERKGLTFTCRVRGRPCKS